jgi:hypothetical protein
MGVERADERCKARGTLKERHNKGARFKTEAGESHRTTSCEVGVCSLKTE